MVYIERWAEQYDGQVPTPLANHAEALFEVIKLLEATGKSVGSKAEVRNHQEVLSCFVTDTDGRCPIRSLASSGGFF